MIGGQMVDLVIIINTEEALEAFKTDSNYSFGGVISLTAGPLGRDIGVDVSFPLAPMFSYSRTAGFCLDASIQGTIFSSRQSVNEKFYGKVVTADEVLEGKVAVPDGCEEWARFQQILNEKFGKGEI